MVFCNLDTRDFINGVNTVTILILVDGFLQSKSSSGTLSAKIGHNPYFSRWFSAIEFSHYKRIMYGESQSLF